MTDRSSARARGQLYKWLFVAGWLLVIFLASTDELSAAHTSRLIEPLLKWCYPQISVAALDTIHFFVRKAAHVTEYAILALLLGRALTHGKRLLTWRQNGVVWIIAAAYAGSDEFHQSFVPSRGSSLHDAGIDAAGAMLGLVLLWLWRRRESAAPFQPEDAD